MNRQQKLTLARTKGTHTQEEWLEMVVFFSCCVICGRDDPLEKDHIIPLYQGGSDSITNLQPVCPWCNTSKSSNSDDFRRSYCSLKGLKMPQKWLKQ